MKKILMLATCMSTVSATAATLGGFDTEVYGFLKASAMYGDKALNSFNTTNFSAPTNAAPHVSGVDQTSRLSFQTQQSRIGFNVKKGEELSAKFEFDFIDFSKATPTTQMVPRVRIAAVTYAWGNGNKVIIGQDWDLFSPTTSYTFDYVGLYFLAGNSGFMRDQAQYLKTMDRIELGAALGLSAPNPGVQDNDVELGKGPTYALRGSYKLDQGRIGLSGIYSSLGLNSSSAAAKAVRRDAYGLNAFYEQVHGLLAVKSELYYGQNLANLGSLTIGKGNSTNNAREYGATFTGMLKVSDTGSIFGGVGTARSDNPAAIVPLTPSTGIGPLTFAGIRSNFLSRAGYDHKITPDLSWISEVSRYETRTHVSASERQTVVAYSLESGIQLKF